MVNFWVEEGSIDIICKDRQNQKLLNALYLEIIMYVFKHLNELVLRCPIVNLLPHA